MFFYSIQFFTDSFRYFNKFFEIPSLCFLRIHPTTYHSISLTQRFSLQYLRFMLQFCWNYLKCFSGYFSKNNPRNFPKNLSKKTLIIFKILSMNPPKESLLTNTSPENLPRISRKLPQFFFQDFFEFFFIREFFH